MDNVKTYAVINSESSLVENVILWDGESNWTPPIGTFVVTLAGGAGIGWKYENNQFIDIRPTPEPEQIAIQTESVVTEQQPQV